MAATLVYNSDNLEKPIRQLIVDDVEKYRLVITDNKDELIYAKGKVNLDINYTYKDSNQEERPIPGTEPKWMERVIPKVYFAFYNDGFYRKSNDYYYKYEDGLPDLQKYNDVASFLGWWTAKDGGKQIDEVNDLKDILFNYRQDDILPEITLYAHWAVPTYTITVHNISNTSTKKINKKAIKGQSSFKYYDEKEKKYITTTKKSVPFHKILYGTDFVKYLNKKITEVKYSSWAGRITNLRKTQKFLGWSDDRYGHALDGPFYVNENGYIRETPW